MYHFKGEKIVNLVLPFLSLQYDLSVGFALCNHVFLFLGDIDQKPYVSGEGDVTTHVLSGTEDFLLLACDGFFDAVISSEVPGLVLGHLQENDGDGQHVAESLVCAAKEAGSSDNITVMVIFLRDPAKVLEDFLAHGSVEAEPLFDFGDGGAEGGSDYAG